MGEGQSACGKARAKAAHAGRKGGLPRLTRLRTAPACRGRRSIHALQDNARDVAQSKSLGEATGKLRALQRRFQDVRAPAAPRARSSLTPVRSN